MVKSPMLENPARLYRVYASICVGTVLQDGRGLLLGGPALPVKLVTVDKRAHLEMVTRKKHTHGRATARVARFL